MIRYHFQAEVEKGEVCCDGQEILQVVWKSFHELEQMEDEHLFCPEIFRTIIDDVKKTQLHPLQVLKEYVPIK